MSCVVEESRHSEAVVSRKRARSASSGPESDGKSKKKLPVVNGACDEPTSEAIQERVVILDAGAQYGKV